MARLENWKIGGDPNNSPYTAPEARTFVLAGVVYGHPRFTDGETITTSAIKSMNADYTEAVTYSGSVYVLGKPDADYVRWCVEHKAPSAAALASRLTNGLDRILELASKVKH